MLEAVRPQVCFTPPGANLIVAKIPHDVSKRNLRLSIHLINDFDNLRLFRTNNVFGGLYSINNAGLDRIPIGDRTAHKESVLRAGGIGICHSLLNSFTFKLRKDDADIQHSPPHRGRSVELLRCGHELNTVLVELVHHGGKVQDGAADSVQLIHNDTLGCLCK